LLYLEHIPAAPLHAFVRTLWYTKAPQLEHHRERVLPNGCTQVILNLERDYLLDCPEGEAAQPWPAALIVGGRSIYEIVDSSDMADLIGVVFEPGGFPVFARDAADRFSNRSVALEDVWGAPARSLRDRLREAPDARERFRCLEEFLLERLAARASLRAPMPALISGSVRQQMAQFALSRFGRAPAMTTVRDVARSTGWSERRFSQVFREQVGHSPKVWCRIQRFQQAVRLLHAGADVRWAELALDCGFYDQSHFANEFRAFSGVDATTYSAMRTKWANHIRVE
jgi:AraC-like DNA-binding protein